MAEEFAPHYAGIVDERLAVGGTEAQSLLHIVVVELALSKDQDLLELLRFVFFIKVRWKLRSLERLRDSVTIVLQTARNTGM